MQSVQDVRRDVVATLGGYEDQYDVDGIVQEVRRLTGGESVSSLDEDQYWDVVRSHDVG